MNKRKIEDDKRSRDFFEGLFVALIAALIIRQFIVQAYRIPTSSMEDTLLIGDFLLVNKFNYGMRTPDWIGIPYTDIGFDIPWVRIPGFKTPKPNDVVIFRYPLDPSLDYIKRCIAIGDQTIEVVDKEVFVDGVQFPRPPDMKFMDKKTIMRKNEGRYTFPTFDNNKYGSRDNFGPLKVPAQGDTIQINLINLPVYQRIIEVYEHNDLQLSEGMMPILIIKKNLFQHKNMKLY